MILDERVKTDIRVSDILLEVVDTQGKKLGIPKNAFFTMGACLLAVQLAPMIRGTQKRDKMIEKVEKVFSETLAKYKNLAQERDIPK